jgi:hypothetical protein
MLEYFLPNLAIFLGITFVVILVAAAITFYRREVNIKTYLVAQGQGAIKSAALGVSVIVFLALLVFLLPNNANASPLKNGTWFNDAGVYIGLDYTRKLSPQCDAGGVDDRGTSNMGAFANLWQSKDKTLRVNSRYTHHSCFIGSDNRGYDGVGVQVEWFLWKR